MEAFMSKTTGSMELAVDMAATVIPSPFLVETWKDANQTCPP